jgi:hypothetical protein
MLSQRSVVVLSALCLGGSAFSQDNIVLFVPPDATCAVGIAINDAGTSTGFYCGTQSGLEAYIRDAGGNFTKFGVPGSQSTTPGSINSSGVIVGFYFDTKGIHSFLREASGSIIPFDPPDSTQSHAYHINNAGEITGTCNSTRGEGYIRHADGSFIEFSVPGALVVTPHRINASGTIVGIYDRTDGAGGFIRERDGTIVKFDPPDSKTLQTVSINAGGTIAGSYFDQQSILRGFVRDPSGNFTQLFPGNDFVSVAGINDAGAVTGNVQPSFRVGDAFVYHPNGAIRRFRPPPGSGCAALEPAGINRSGTVTGGCTDPEVAFIFIP